MTGLHSTQPVCWTRLGLHLGAAAHKPAGPDWALLRALLRASLKALLKVTAERRMPALEGAHLCGLGLGLGLGLGSLRVRVRNGVRFGVT